MMPDTTQPNVTPFGEVPLLPAIGQVPDVAQAPPTGQAPPANQQQPSDAHTNQPPSARGDTPCLDRVERLLDASETALDLLTRERAAALDLKLSVVIPVYNERETIREIVRRVQTVPLDMEIIIVDDASTDGTRDILRELEQQPGVSVVYHEFNHGKGAALRTGFLHARGQLVVVQDADLEYDPTDYLRLVEPILSGRADVVYGSRFLDHRRQARSLVHRLGNGALTALSNLLTGQHLTDMETCYKVMRREALEEFDLKQDGFGFEPEITAKLARRGERFCEVPIRYQGRSAEAGKKIGLKDAFGALYCIVRYAIAD